MHRQLVLTAIVCLCTAGCAKDSAMVAGDPFLTPGQDWPTDTIGEPAQPKQTASIAEDQVEQARFERPAK